MDRAGVRCQSVDRPTEARGWESPCTHRAISALTAWMEKEAVPTKRALGPLRISLRGIITCSVLIPRKRLLCFAKLSL